MNSKNPVDMEIGVPDDPHWLRPLVGTQFRKECDTHHKPCNRFCTKCFETTAHCEICTNNFHKDHQILVVYKASRSHALRVEDVDGLLNTSKIHRFSFNKHNILYLKSRKIDEEHKNRKDVASKCVTCGWEINKNSKFCSFSCKLESSVKIATPTAEKVKVKVDSNSLRKRSRKGKPIRALLL